MADTGDSATKLDSGAIYRDVSQTTVCALRLFGVIVALMVVISFILALVQGMDNPTFYLLACNVVISSFVAVVLIWWYRGGDLQADKYWLLILLGCVIAIQSITTDVYVFHVIPVPQDLTTTSLAPNMSSIFTTLNTTNKSIDFPFTQPASPSPIKLTAIGNEGL
ncbi:uncharacterized protein LOC135474465 [Liolophura sinensis]|uniref:uncharacterized protein LOC135474465 n=1 Tax=Liolophura sinensis TaxID=3198878 RepID=UPI0031581AE4